MTIIWDDITKRRYETGVDRGVLYLSDGRAVPWNGLTSITEKGDRKSNSVYYDGIKISELIVILGFSGVLKAITYPDEFLEVEGLGQGRPGFYYDGQPSELFSLSYRTKIGNDQDEDLGYKIHLLYNVTAIPRDKNYQTVSDDTSPIEFEWDISAIPEEVSGMRPTAHYILDSRELDPWLLSSIEAYLYGTETSQPRLLSIQELVDYLETWCRFTVVDNADGTWTGTSADPEGVKEDPATGIVELNGASVTFLDDSGTILLTSACDESDIYKIAIVDNGDGTWFASTPHDGYISVDAEGLFEITGADAVFVNPESYEISSTPYDE